MNPEGPLARTVEFAHVNGLPLAEVQAPGLDAEGHFDDVAVVVGGGGELTRHGGS
jgi:hypothetical protein